MFEKTIAQLQRADANLTVEEFLDIFKILYRDVHTGTRNYVSMLPVKNDNALIDSLKYVAQYYTLGIYEQNESRIRSTGRSSELDDLIFRLRQVDEELYDITNQDSVIENKNKELGHQISAKEEAKKELEKKKARKNALEAECSRLDAEINELEKITLVELENRKKHLNTVVEPLRITRGEIQKDIKENYNVIQELLKDQNHIFNVISGDLTRDIETLKDENINLQKTIDLKNQDWSTKNSEKSRLNTELQSRDLKIVDLNKTITELKEKLLDSEKIEELKSIQLEKDLVEKQVHDKETEKTSLEQRITSLRDELCQLKEENAKLEAQAAEEVSAKEKEEERHLQAILELTRRKETLTEACIKLKKSIDQISSDINDKENLEKALKKELESPEIRKQEAYLKNLQARVKNLEDLRKRFAKSVDTLSCLVGKQDAAEVFKVKLDTEELNNLGEILEKYLTVYRDIQEQFNDQ